MLKFSPLLASRFLSKVRGSRLHLQIWGAVWLWKEYGGSVALEGMGSDGKHRGWRETMAAACGSAR